MGDSKVKKPESHGEGDRESAKRFNKAQEDFAQSDSGQEKIDKAGDLEGDAKRKAEKAEEEASKRAREKDPQVNRDYHKSEE